MLNESCVLANIPFGDECFLSLELSGDTLAIIRLDGDIPGGSEVVQTFSASRGGLSKALTRLNELFIATAQ